MNINNKQVQEMFTDAWDEHFADNPGCAPALKEACDAVAGAYGHVHRGFAVPALERMLAADRAR